MKMYTIQYKIAIMMVTLCCGHSLNILLHNPTTLDARGFNSNRPPTCLFSLWDIERNAGHFCNTNTLCEIHSPIGTEASIEEDNFCHTRKYILRRKDIFS